MDWLKSMIAFVARRGARLGGHISVHSAWPTRKWGACRIMCASKVEVRMQLGRGPGFFLPTLIQPSLSITHLHKELHRVVQHRHGQLAHLHQGLQ